MILCTILINLTPSPGFPKQSTYACGFLRLTEMDHFFNMKFLYILLLSKNFSFQYLANGSSISDYPRFLHRGFMIDTSRHFLEPSVIFKFIVSRRILGGKNKVSQNPRIRKVLKADCGAQILIR